MIDAHHHLWQIGRNGHGWPTPDLTAIYRDFGMDDLRSATADQGLSGSILVQSQPSDTDTDWLLEVAADDDLITGVVGWADLAAPDAVTRIGWLARQPKLKGLRPMLQSLPDDHWITQPAIRPAIEAMIAHDLSLDALIFTRHLPALDQLATNYPDLSIVIDHGAKPPIATRYSHPEETRHWREQITTAAHNPNVFVKLSGLVTEMSAAQVTDREWDELWPYVDHLLASFGPARTMWGSDWPVVNLRVPYRRWRERLYAHLRALPAADLESIFATTAMRFYKLAPSEGNRS